jgi:hypothetical protein
MALDAERELTQWTAGTDVKRTSRTAAFDASVGRSDRRKDRSQRRSLRPRLAEWAVNRLTLRPPEGS